MENEGISWYNEKKIIIMKGTQEQGGKVCKERGDLNQEPKRIRAWTRKQQSHPLETFFHLVGKGPKLPAQDKI